jgi:hypothetical protein
MADLDRTSKASPAVIPKPFNGPSLEHTMLLHPVNVDAACGDLQEDDVRIDALVTLAAVLLGGLMTVLGQVALEALHRGRDARRVRRERQVTIRIIKFQLYCAEHVMKRALESRTWWPSSDELTLGEPGEDLKVLADLLPEFEWRIYTSAWRQLRECARLRPGPNVSVGDGDNSGHTQNQVDRIPSTALLQLLGAFVTVDDARHRLEPYGLDRSTGEITIRPVGLTSTDMSDALHNYAGHLVDVSAWTTRLGVVADH